MAARKPVRVIAVAGGKGGVGRTTVAINLSIELSARGRRVILVDGDLGLANIDTALGLYPILTIKDVIESRCQIRDTFIRGPKEILIVPGASGAQSILNLSTMQHAGLIYAFDELASEIDILVVDTASGIGRSVVNLAKAASDVLVVVCDEPTSLFNAYSQIKLLSRNHGASNFKILVNMARSSDEGLSTFGKLNNATSKFLDLSVNYAGVLPYDECVKKAAYKRAAVVQCYPKSKYSIAVKNIAQALDDSQIDTRRNGIAFFLNSCFKPQ